MSGTSSSLSSDGGGFGLPVPQLRILTQGNGDGRHDRLYVGHMLKAEFEAVKELQPTLFLYRYKRGFSANQSRGYRYDRIRGFVHPSNWVNENTVRSVNYGGGAHTSRNGSNLGDRQTEWPVTRELDYYALWEPEFWFTDNGATLSYPINDGRIGQSGQSSGGLWIESDQCPGNKSSKQTQRQIFAFGYAIKDQNNPRNWIRGAMSEHVIAEIFPKQRLSYCIAPQQNIGRKIRLTIESR